MKSVLADLYSEDHTWRLRIIRADWQLVFEPKAVLTRHGSQFSCFEGTILAN